MALVYPIPIPDNALDVSFPAPQYENDFASIVGDAGTDSDGFETLFLEASQILIDAPVFLAGLDVALNALVTAYPGVTTPWEQDFGDTLANAISQGQPDFDKFSVDLTGNTPPPPGGAPGAGGGPSGGTTQCAATQDFGNVPQGTVKSIKINITNNGSAAITIKGLVVASQTGANIFAISSTYAGHRLAAGASIPLTINADGDANSPQDFLSVLTINTDQPDPQPCMLLKATVVTGTIPPGGGGGGGGGDDGGCDVGFDSHGRLGCID